MKTSIGGTPCTGKKNDATSVPYDNHMLLILMGICLLAFLMDVLFSETSLLIFNWRLLVFTCILVFCAAVSHVLSYCSVLLSKINRKRIALVGKELCVCVSVATSFLFFTIGVATFTGPNDHSLVHINLVLLKSVICVIVSLFWAFLASYTYDHMEMSEGELGNADFKNAEDKV